VPWLKDLQVSQDHTSLISKDSSKRCNKGAILAHNTSVKPSIGLTNWLQLENQLKKKISIKKSTSFLNSLPKILTYNSSILSSLNETSHTPHCSWQKHSTYL
jgi:hypothetical protein